MTPEGIMPPMESEITPEQKEKVALEALRARGWNIKNISIPGASGTERKMWNEDDVPVGDYNEMNGVILTNIGGEILAIPANEKTRGWIADSGLNYNEGISVPHLNNLDTLGGPGASLAEEWRAVTQRV